MIVDLFAGCGGWDEGVRLAGTTDPMVGLEWDRWACATRAAAGHLTIRSDVETCPTAPFTGRVQGLTASPPCQDFSLAGKGVGRTGDRGRLIDVVPRWVEVLRPEWVLCEQVPPCLSIWAEHAARYRELGYSTWCGVLNSADFGVPQTRRRAVLMASRVGAAVPPEPTHARTPTVGLFGPAHQPWVSMAEALGWTGKGVDRPARTVCGQRQPRWVYEDRDGTHGDIVLRAGATSNAALRSAESPAPTILANAAKNGGWVWERPATTLVGSCCPEGSIRITETDALILQSFRPDYPLQGPKTARFRQVGNAIPPMLAGHLIAAVTR